MTMGVKVYYAEISGHKEVKKRQQRVMMILESKLIPYEAIDITEPGKEDAKEFMLKNAKPRGDSKYVLSPQIFHDETYCGDYDDFDLANENDVLESFLNTPKVERKFSLATTQVSQPAGTENNEGGQNGGRESSAEAEAVVPSTTTSQEDGPLANGSVTEPSSTAETEVTSTTEELPVLPPAASVVAGDEDDEGLEIGDEEEPEAGDVVEKEQ